MADDKIYMVHLEKYNAEMAKFNARKLRPIPPPIDPRLWSGSTYGLVTHLGEVQAFARHAKYVLENHRINTAQEFKQFEELCMKASSSSAIIQNYWLDRRTKLGYALNASIYWSHWNENVREFFLTGLVKSKREGFVSVVYGDARKNINGHSYLNGLFAGATNDLLYDSDGKDDVTSAGEAANDLVRNALDKSRKKVRDIEDVCRKNIKNCEETYAHIVTLLDQHKLAEQELGRLLTSIGSIRGRKEVIYEHAIGDQKGGPGS